MLPLEARAGYRAWLRTNIVTGVPTSLTRAVYLRVCLPQSKATEATIMQCLPPPAKVVSFQRFTLEEVGDRRVGPTCTVVLPGFMVQPTMMMVVLCCLTERCLLYRETGISSFVYFYYIYCASSAVFARIPDLVILAASGPRTLSDGRFPQLFRAQFVGAGSCAGRARSARVLS